MELELKHLAPYLPYGLKVMLTESSKIAEMFVLNRIPFRGQIQIQTIYGTHGDMYFKPILRPLSDLIKEINYGLSNYTFIDLFEIGDCDGCIFEFEHGNIKTIKALEFIAKHNSYNDINYLPNAVVNMMYEHHFDVFGLIEQKLAIDINTLNK